jgi:hypothetical protein
MKYETQGGGVVDIVVLCSEYRVDLEVVASVSEKHAAYTVRTLPLISVNGVSLLAPTMSSFLAALVGQLASSNSLPNPMWSIG